MLHVYSKALGPFLVWGCLPSPVVRASPAPCARAPPHPPRDRTPTHRSRAVPPRTQSLQLVFVAVGAASQAINYGALVRYGEPGWLKSTLTMRCNLVACTTLLLGVAATLVMTVLGHECAGVVPLLFASVFGLSIIPALVRRLQEAVSAHAREMSFRSRGGRGCVPRVRLRSKPGAAAGLARSVEVFVRLRGEHLLDLRRSLGGVRSEHLREKIRSRGETGM